MIRSSPSILFNFLTTPAGLAQWFADTCDVNGDVYTFTWEGHEQNAILEEADDPEYVRFRWEDGDEEEYFEFKIAKSEISNDTVLYITDFADEDEVEDQRLLWESQLKLLTQQLGG